MDRETIKAVIALGHSRNFGKVEGASKAVNGKTSATVLRAAFSEALKIKPPKLAYLRKNPTYVKPKEKLSRVSAIIKCGKEVTNA